MLTEVALEEEEVIGVAFEAEVGEETEVVSEDVGEEEVVDPLHQGKIVFLESINIMK